VQWERLPNQIFYGENNVLALSVISKGLELDRTFGGIRKPLLQKML
jgi:hypothetical protein